MYCVVLKSIVIARKNILLLIISPVLFILDYIAFHYFAELKLTRHMVSPIRPPYCDIHVIRYCNEFNIKST